MTSAQPDLRGLLRRPAYRRLWVARTVSQVGDVAQFTTLALLLISVTGSGLGVSGAVLAEIVPVLALAPLAGSLVDRLPRVQVMVGADLARVLLAGVLVVWHDSAPVAYAVAFGLSCGQVFFSPAAQSLLPSVVEDGELVVANSGIWTAAVTAQVLVAPVAALLAVQVGFGVAFALNAASFAVSALVLRGLHEPERTTPVQVVSPFAHAREGLAALAALPLLKALAVGQLLAALSAGATSALLVVLAQDRLGGASGFGVLVAAIGVGAAIGPLLLLRRITNPRRPLFVFGPYALRGAVDLILAVATNLPLAATALVLYGLSTSTGTVTFASLIQSRVPENLRGRAFAGFDMLWQTGRLLSLLGGGLLADTLGIRAVYLLGGLLLLTAAAVGSRAARATTAPTEVEGTAGSYGRGDRATHPSQDDHRPGGRGRSASGTSGRAPASRRCRWGRRT
ncbi:MFS transporter [Rhodococcus antarcticus]|uniref:MFS transporter n=1 Tax=Rhodococcus antarcticus TaxID=2987751 RepID=A0ABY6P0J0_9NOCA|nr:MFS transporter [Rhodococcus antarcticus]UZJ25162.1 MFS transporter [Rhodococcus antarcticus]